MIGGFQYDITLGPYQQQQLPAMTWTFVIHNNFGALSFWSFEISEDFLRNQKFIIGLDSFSYQCLKYLVPFGNILVFVSTTMLKDAKFQ